MPDGYHAAVFRPAAFPLSTCFPGALLALAVVLGGCGDGAGDQSGAPGGSTDDPAGQGTGQASATPMSRTGSEQAGPAPRVAARG